MSPSFLPYLWSQATVGLDLEKTINLRAIAFKAIDLAESCDATDLFEILTQARRVVTELQTQSRLRFFWPAPESQPAELYDRLKGLANYAELPGMHPQTPSTTHH